MGQGLVHRREAAKVASLLPSPSSLVGEYHLLRVSPHGIKIGGHWGSLTLQ